MSALAHTNNYQTNIDSVQLDSEPAVSSISVSARIDYIQRFSKQAVLVIDDNNSVYSHAASQYLASLSSSTSKLKAHEEANVAFISASTKLNDIQMRCRIVEQLFTNALFDPEKSLVVSISQLIQHNNESITIVVEHAQSLSLQIKFELCQLVEIANKTNQKINVVLFGQEQAAQEAALNKTLFANKLTIIDAKSGQLFALDHAKFKNRNSRFSTKLWQRSIIAGIVITLAIGCAWFILIQHDVFSLAKLPEVHIKPIEKISVVALAKPEKIVSLKESTSAASAIDINNALMSQPVSADIEQVEPAQATDIVQALSFTEIDKINITNTSVNTTQGVANTQTKKSTIESTNKLGSKEISVEKLPVELSTQYYLDHAEGYVIQFAGFKKLDALPSFISNIPDLKYYSYQRMFNDQPFIVITSEIYSDRAQAKQALVALPESLQKRGPWIKPISEIKQEINTFTM